MTREEAIKILMREDSVEISNDEVLEAYTMAIEALKQEPCDDCISREEVLAILGRESRLWGNNYEDWTVAKQEIKEMPSVTPKPKTGHWIAQDIHNCHTDFKCSECGYIHSFMHLYGKPTADYTYCPNCGSRMER